MDNDPKKKRLAMIPAFNEQHMIGNVVKRIREVDQGMDVLVIDDGSKDSTNLFSRLNGARVIRLSSHMGYGVALQTGYKYAFEKGYEFVVQLDGDGQHDPADIPQLLNVISSGEADLVLGSRFLRRGQATGRPSQEHVPSPARKLGIGLFALVASMLVGFRVTDPTSGYQALNRRIISFFVRDFFPCDYPDADVILIAHRAGFRIKEVPIFTYERDNGKSMHRGLKPIYYAFKMFLSIFMTMLRRRPPFVEDERTYGKRFFGS
jgi:glycosyltransferase involved in cell wall biosynthesis